MITAQPQIILPQTTQNIYCTLFPAIKELVSLIKQDYIDCKYHSVIKLNQQYFSEERAEKILKHMITNIYQEYYGKHCCLANKPQMKFIIVPEQGKSGKTTHYHMLHNPIEERFSFEKLEPLAHNFITLSNITTHNIAQLGKENTFIEHICRDYMLFDTNAILTRAIKKVVKNADVETKLIADKYHFDNLCNYLVKEMDKNHIIYYPEQYFQKKLINNIYQ